MIRFSLAAALALLAGPALADRIEAVCERSELINSGSATLCSTDAGFAFQSDGPEVEFFGQPVNASPGAARLALKFGTVMQPLSVVRLPGVRFRVTAHEPIRVPDTGDKAADILAGIQAANAFVEDCVRAHPVDWFWVHKRWPDKVYAALREADQAT